MTDWVVFRWGKGMWVANNRRTADRFAVYSTWGEAIKHALRESA